MNPPEYLSFRLNESFIESYEDRIPPWGFAIGGGNTLGELTFLSKYSRRLPDGTKERWQDTCRRVIEGMTSILKDHCLQNRTPWNEVKAQNTAQDAYERMFTFKWLPPGRGIWMMGTEFVNEKKNSAPLQNCAFVSTEKLSTHSHQEATLPFVRLMEMSMLGVGVGFDTRGADKLVIHEPSAASLSGELRVIDDSREGWFQSVADLLISYFFENRPTLVFDYSSIRPAGELIKGFGGVAAGPGPLIQLHTNIRTLFNGRSGQKVSSSDLVDLMNMIGKCVVSGNVRRSAEIALGDAEDKPFLDLKNWELNPERMGADGWGSVSNNSVFAEVGGNYDHLAERIVANGEPGLFYLVLCRQYGRLVDPPNNRDYRVAGTNPCGEQSLEHMECCTLVETFPINHMSLQDYLRTLKVAYLYGKAVTLLPTHWPETNEVMQRNRRIGCSVSGSAQFAERHGWTELRTWLNMGYEEIERRDHQYSEWLGVRESIKTTSVKPSGTVSLLAGVTPGVHWPTADVYIRRMRLSKNDPLVGVLQKAGYLVEPDFVNPEYDVVVELPTRGPAVRTETEVSVWEKAALAVLHQRYWADNQVSVTLTFRPDESDQVGSVMRAFDGQLKSLTFLPIAEGGAYRQMPYEKISQETYEDISKNVRYLDWASLYAGDSLDAVGEAYCNNDVCEMPKRDELIPIPEDAVDVLAAYVR
jgi:ribonucleoside-triphosphate reductase